MPGDDPRALVPASTVYLVVHRGLSGQPAEAVTHLAARGVPVCNPADGVRVAGEAVFGMLKPSTLLAEHTTVGEPFDPDGAADGVATHLSLHAAQPLG